MFYVENSYSDFALVHSFILTGIDTEYCPPTKLWEGNVFSHVCLFTGLVVVPCDHYTLSAITVQGQPHPTHPCDAPLPPPPPLFRPGGTCG